MSQKDVLGGGFVDLRALRVSNSCESVCKQHIAHSQLRCCDAYAVLVPQRFNSPRLIPVPQPPLEILEQLDRGLGDDGARAEDVTGAG